MNGTNTNKKYYFPFCFPPHVHFPSIHNLMKYHDLQNKPWVCKMTQQGKMLAAEPDDLCSVPGGPMGEGEINSCKKSQLPHANSVACVSHMHHTHTLSYKCRHTE